MVPVRVTPYLLPTTIMVQIQSASRLPEHHTIHLNTTNEKDTRPKHIPIVSKTAGPEELVDVALHKLQVAGFELIEWRTPLYRRMCVPVILMVINLL